MNNRQRIKKAIVFTSIFFFLISLTQDCFCTSSRCINSSIALLFGWIEICGGDLAGISWFANILLVSSWILMLVNSKHTTLINFLSILLCLVFLVERKVMRDEAGHFEKITTVKMGYWLWLASTVILLSGDLFLKFNKSGKSGDTRTSFR